MNKKHMWIAVAAMLGSAATVSQAAVVNLTGWALGNGNNVTVGAPNHVGAAGGFRGSVDFSAAEEAGGFSDVLGNSFITYCVEINESFNLPSGNLLGYAVQSASSFASILGPLGAAKANRLGQLMSHVNANASLVDNAAESTSLQLAVWNVIYDSDDNLNIGPFKENSLGDNFKSYANTLLNDSLGATNIYDVFVLSKAGSQDFLLLRELPEPSSLMLTFAALAGIGFAARRRKS